MLRIIESEIFGHVPISGAFMLLSETPDSLKPVRLKWDIPVCFIGEIAERNGVPSRFDKMFD